MIAEITQVIEPHSKTCFLLKADRCTCGPSIVPFAWKILVVLTVGKRYTVLWKLTDTYQRSLPVGTFS